MPRTKPSPGRILITVFNIILMIAVLLISALLALSSLKSGTFTLFDRSWYYYQSDVMAGDVERGEMLIIHAESPVNFQPDDLVAYYSNDSATGNRVIQIARLQSVDGSVYLLAESSGEPFTVDSTETVFVGKVTTHSKLLGRLVQQMKTTDGRRIYRRWTLVFLMFACGLTVLLHVQHVRKLPVEPEYDEYDDYEEAYDDEDYPEEEGMQLDRLPTDPRQPVYDQYDDYDNDDDYEEEPEEDTGYVDEDNMNLIAASTESEEEEEVDFEAIFREIRRQTGDDN